MMRVALICSKDATTPDWQLLLQGNKHAQNEANGTQEFPGQRGAVVRIRNFMAYAVDSADALGVWQKAEIAKWWPMIKAANVKVD